MKIKFRITALLLATVMVLGIPAFAAVNPDDPAVVEIIYEDNFTSRNASAINHDGVEWTTMSGAEQLGFIDKRNEVSVSAPTSANVIMQMNPPLAGDIYEINYNLYVNGTDGTAYMGILDEISTSDANLTNALVFNHSMQSFTVGGAVLKASDGSEATYENVLGTAAFKENPVNVAMNIDFQNNIYSISIKGTTGKVFSGTTAFPYQTLGTLHWVCGNRIYIGDMSIVKKQFCIVDAGYGEGYVDVTFSDSIASIGALSEYSLYPVYGGDEILLTGATKLSDNGVRLTFDGALAAGCEYAVTVSEDVTNTSGGKIGGTKTYFTTQSNNQTAWEEIFSEDFSGYTRRLPQAHDGVSWGSINERQLTNNDSVSADNLSFNSQGVSWMTFDEAFSGTKYSLDFDINFWDATQTVIKFSESALSSDSGTYGFYANPNNDGSGYYIHTNTEAGTYTKEYLKDTNGVNATVENVFSSTTGDKKTITHNLKIIFDFAGDTITYELTANNGTKYSATTGFAMNQIKSICFSTADRIAISDIVIEKEIELAAPGVKSVRFIDLNGKTVYPDTEITSLCNKVVVTLNTAMEKFVLDAAVTLLRNEVSEETFLSQISDDGKTYTMLLDQYLTGSSLYKICIPAGIEDKAGGVTTEFSYSFATMPGECVFKKEFITNKSLAQLQVGDTVEFYGVVIDTTATGREAVLSLAALNGSSFSDYDFAVLDIAEGFTSAEATLTVSVESLDNLSIKGMLWKSFNSLERIEKATVLN